MAEDARTPPSRLTGGGCRTGRLRPSEPGAPIPPDAIDPELLKLSGAAAAPASAGRDRGAVARGGRCCFIACGQI